MKNVLKKQFAFRDLCITSFGVKIVLFGIFLAKFFTRMYSYVFKILLKISSKSPNFSAQSKLCRGLFLFIVICIFSGILTSSNPEIYAKHSSEVCVSKGPHINKMAINWRNTVDGFIKLLSRLEIFTLLALVLFLKKTYSGFNFSSILDRSYSFTKKTILSSQAHPPTV